jgi:Pectinacetylesterase
LSPDPKVNPDFSDWNLVHFNYCDGASFSGNRASPLEVNGTKLHMRGHAILKALFGELRETYGFGKATHVLLSGCSAGGLSTYLHADYIHDTFVPASADYKAMPISGYFLDFPNVFGKKVYTDEMKYVFRMQHVGTSDVTTNERCMHRYRATGDEWKCIMAQYVLPFIEVPYFAYNSLYDQWQMGNVVGAQAPKYDQCAVHFPNNCTVQDIKFANSFHDSMRKDYENTPSFANQAKNGAFLHSCWGHCWANSPKGESCLFCVSLTVG